MPCRTLVIYYSFDGNTRLIAEALAREIGADLLELKPEREPPHHGFSKFFWGGFQVMMKRVPALLPFEYHPSDYDLLFIGTPVWAFTYTPALAAFFDRFPVTGKKVALFCCSGGACGRTLAKMRRRLWGNDIVGEKHFVEPLRRQPQDAADEARRWARALAGR
ncbi:MAG: flavodoxin family protein [Deltaproteobacteria bacterium]